MQKLNDKELEMVTRDLLYEWLKSNIFINTYVLPLDIIKTYTDGKIDVCTDKE